MREGARGADCRPGSSTARAEIDEWPVEARGGHAARGRSQPATTLSHGPVATAAGLPPRPPDAQLIHRAGGGRAGNSPRAASVVAHEGSRFHWVVAFTGHPSCGRGYPAALPRGIPLPRCTLTRLFRRRRVRARPPPVFPAFRPNNPKGSVAHVDREAGPTAPTRSSSCRC
jgi:hypothetical protein